MFLMIFFFLPELTTGWKGLVQSKAAVSSPGIVWIQNYHFVKVMKFQYAVIMSFSYTSVCLICILPVQLRHIENHLEAAPGTGVLLDSVMDLPKKKSSRSVRSRGKLLQNVSPQFADILIISILNSRYNIFNMTLSQMEDMLMTIKGPQNRGGVVSRVRTRVIPAVH